MKRKKCGLFVSFLEMQNWLVSAWIRRKENVNEEIAVFCYNVYFDFNRITHFLEC